MPNHITNIIRFTGEPDDIVRLLKQIAYDDSSEQDILGGVHSIDFNKIISQPEDIGDGWYDWRVAHWGTKWNSYGYEYSEESDDTIWFDTAWSAPHPVIEKLSEMFPEVGIEHCWADEDIGYNCGRYDYSDGVRIGEYYPEGKEAIEFACDIKGTSPDELDLIPNATNTDYVCSEYPDFQVIEVCGQTALYSDERLKMTDIPKGFHLYHLRESDNGDGFASLERKVLVNHGGSVVTKEPIDFAGKDRIDFTDETYPNFTSAEATFGMLLRNEIDLTENQGMEGM